MKITVWAAALAAVTLFSSDPHPAKAGPIGFGTDGSSLFSIDLGTAISTLIGNVGVPLESLAFSPGGILYGADAGGILYTIDTATGTPTAVGATGLGRIEGLDFNGDTLLASDFSPSTTIYALDPATAAPSFVATSGPPQGVARSLAVLDADTVLIVSDTPSLRSLVSIDLTLGTSTVLGTIQTENIFGIDFGPNGVLYGVDRLGDEYTINPTDGSTTLVGSTGIRLRGLAIQAVPEPAGLAMLTSGALVLLVYAGRRNTARKRSLRFRGGLARRTFGTPALRGRRFHLRSV
jgi:hypothetical protein